jgi:hypothetical protein
MSSLKLLSKKSRSIKSAHSENFNSLIYIICLVVNI